MAFADYLIHLGTLTAIFTVLGVSFGLLVGYGGIIQLGHLAFFGIAAYTSAILTLKGVPIFAAAFVSIAVVATASLILAFPTVRLKSHYIALATLAFIFVASALARNLEITHGALGLPGVPAIFSSNLSYLLLAVALAATVIAISYRLVHSSFGRTLQAIRDDETAAKVLGKNTIAHKTTMFVIASVFAAVAGVLYVHYIRFVDPEVFNLFDIVMLLAMVIVGGLASIRGAVVGSVLIFLLPEPLRFVGLPAWALGPLREILFATILLLVLLSKPRGIFGKIDLE